MRHRSISESKMREESTPVTTRYQSASQIIKKENADPTGPLRPVSEYIWFI